MNNDDNTEENSNKNDYSDLTVVQIKELLDSKGIQYTSSMKKDDLISLLENSEG